jgi:DNA-binding NarL/FixJ family response regulator
MGTARRPRILIADDYVSLHEALTRLLTTSMACDVVGRVFDGLEAIDATRRLLPDIVVLDLVMPGMNGLMACREIKAIAPAAHVILLTAEDDAELRAQALEAGAAALVPKYRVADDLVRVLQELASADER